MSFRNHFNEQLVLSGHLSPFFSVKSEAVFGKSHSPKGDQTNLEVLLFTELLRQSRGKH